MTWLHDERIKALEADLRHARQWANRMCDDTYADRFGLPRYVMSPEGDFGLAPAYEEAWRYTHGDSVYASDPFQNVTASDNWHVGKLVQP